MTEFEINLVHDMEELAELQKEISKMLRSKGNKDNLTNEIVDVLISIDDIIERCDLDLKKIITLNERRAKMKIEFDTCCKCGCHIKDNPIIIQSEKYCNKCALAKLREDKQK